MARTPWARRPPGRLDRSSVTIRVAAHVAAEVPIVAAAVGALVAGWRPLWDNAGIAWRAYDVLSGASPLVGAVTSHVAGLRGTLFGPGPLEFWLLAVPVRLDPGSGALWGAALAALVAVAVAVEAAWSVAGARGATAVALAAVGLALTWPQAAVDPTWNPWLGAWWLLAALATSWAAGAGRLRWWPVAVGAASVAAQCHEVFAPAAVAAVAAGGALGWLQARRPGGVAPRCWLLVGLVIGCVLWAPPVIQQLTGHPGNLGRLWSQAHEPLARLGFSRAFSALGAVTRPWPVWLQRPPQDGSKALFVGIGRVFGGSELWGAVALGLLAAVAVAAWWRGRAALSAAAGVSLLAALGVLVALAAVPGIEVLSLAYLDVVLWPVGMAAWGSLAWGVASAVASLGRHLVQVPRPALSAWPVVAAGLVGLAAWASTVTATVVGSPTLSLSPPDEVAQAEALAPEALRLAPAKPFELVARGAPSSVVLAVESDVAYELHVAGRRPRFSFDEFVGLPPPSAGLPVVELELARPGGRPGVLGPRPASRR